METCWEVTAEIQMRDGGTWMRVVAVGVLSSGWILDFS